jgi:hypothetical protein
LTVPERSPVRPPPTLLKLGQHDLAARLIDSVRDYAIFMLSPEGVIASWNAGAERLKGYTAQEAIGHHFSMFYLRDAVDAGWPLEELRRAREDGRVEDEGWRVRKDGSRFWANVVISPVWGRAAELLGFSKVTRDLTERREHEVRLRESERSLRLLVEGVQDYAIFRLDADGVITSWNRGAERIKGWSAAEAIGRHFSMFYLPDAVASGWPAEELERAAAQGRFEDEGWRVRKDGSLLWANVIITAIRDESGRLIGYSKVTRDLTERRRHEQRLRESEENLRLVVEGVRDHAMFLLGPDGAVASWNVGAQRVLGWTDDTVLGRPMETFYPAEDRAAGKPRAELESARHTGFLETEGWRERADGTRFWAHCETTALHDAGGTPGGYVQVMRDLSERMRVRELEDEGQRIHEFIAMLSHELRNPLAPIGNAVGLLRRAGGSPEVGRCADMIGRQVDHLARLVDDLLDVSRVTSGRIHVQAQLLELNTLVKLALDAVHGELDDRSHRLELLLGPEPIFVEGDATRLHQVVTNLLSNAARYTPAGGLVRVSVDAEAPGVATLVVADNGMGMSEPLIQRAFDPFVQGSRKLDRGNGGLGIGLTLVKKIVELHGGRVVAASPGEGKGTRIAVTLPLALGAPSANAAPAVSPAPHARARSILVVDDNRDAAESLGELLRLAGHAVRIASDGEQALDMARANRPDTVLLDLGLPGMDGFEVARRLHLLPGLQGAHLVAITGYGQASDREATRQAGFAAHLVKPVDFDALEKLLD